MAKDFKKIICPNCKTEISLDEAITHQFEEEIKKQITEEQQSKQAEILNKEKQIIEKEKKLIESKKTFDKDVAEQAEKAKIEIEKDLRLKIYKEKEEEIKSLANDLKEKEILVAEARQAELDIRREKNKFEDQKRAFELEKQRQLDSERDKIREDAQKKAEEEMHLKILEKEKQLQDAIKVNMELQRKLQQGSQQTQGEVLELELEELLKGWFTHDTIEPVAKGINGVDVIQKVFTNSGQYCGLIAWESKYTKAWSEQWVSKLKEDQRKINADIAVLVTEVLPKDIKNFSYYNGVWITDQNSLFGLGTALRIQLIQATTIKLSSIGKNEKMEVLYGYLSGTEFRHKVEAIVEAFVGMKQDLDKERRSMTKIWSKREKQIEQVVNNTAGMYGDIEGLLGSAIQPITALEAGHDLIEDEDENEEYNKE